LIDRLNPLSDKPLRAGNESIPERYRSGGRMKVRYLLPLINYVYNSSGAEAFQTTIEELGFEKSFFVNIDHELNPMFLNDLLNTIDVYGQNGDAVLGKISELAGQPECHASLAETYQRAATKSDLLGSFADNQKYYQPFYAHRFSSDKSGIRISIEHEPKLRGALLELPYKTLLFMREYALLSLREIAQFPGRPRERGVRCTINRSEDMLNPGVIEITPA
jgi:hypothetical protein